MLCALLVHLMKYRVQPVNMDMDYLQLLVVLHHALVSIHGNWDLLTKDISASVK